MSKHTPGKWAPAFVSKICVGVQSGHPYGQMICNTILPETDKQYKKEKAEIEANARLIAAAPEMYELLTKMLDGWDARDLSGPEPSYVSETRTILATLNK